jgi:hypothetical protein
MGGKVIIVDDDDDGDIVGIENKVEKRPKQLNDPFWGDQLWDDQLWKCGWCGSSGCTEEAITL